MRAVNQPASWWGWHWTPPLPMSIVEILAARSMPLRLAALFWVALERGASLVVAADPPSSGKTTTLTALLAFTPPETAAYFTRGIGEGFDLPPRTDSYPTYLLVNEMSDHLPVYTWGPYAKRAFELVAQGYSLATTMHANTVAEVIAILEEELAIPRPHIANLTLIVPLHIGQRGEVIRRVAEVTFLRPHADNGFALSTLARWNPEDDSFTLFPSARARQEFARWASLKPKQLEAELQRREAFLQELLTSGRTAIPDVNQAIEDYYRQIVASSRQRKR